MEIRLSSPPSFRTALCLSILGHALLVLLVPHAKSARPSISTTSIHVTLAASPSRPAPSAAIQSLTPAPEKKTAPKASSTIKAPSPVAITKDIQTAISPPLSKHTEPPGESRPEINNTYPATESTSLGETGVPSGKAPEQAPPPIQPPRFNAAYLHNPKPIYPPQARRRGIEGKVILQVSVSPEGQVLHIHIHQSSGHSSLDEAAQNSVMNWRFIPAQQGDTPISASVRVPIIFKLES